METNIGNAFDGVHLLQLIANKDKDRNEAENALSLFTSYFEKKLFKPVEIIASKNGYDENVAFEAILCAFNKVWNYPTFEMRKSHCKNEENAIINWLIRIAVSQMYDYSRKGVCAHITKEEDLSVIENASDFIDYHISDYDPHRKLELVQALENKLSILDEKHRIIYLTYKAYHICGKKLPRKVLGKLRKRLGITQVTVRVYKKEACEALNDLTLLEA
ncbi:RNA polymerase subunit sigma [Segatella bryantii]|uniref:RNA polymerase subunit sigma n=1 Tax=Segatella bryantii TaxID=77095 RepID=UPI001EDBF571|nr:RNA polymerase subunit sigma [Segatella bryantii]UKK74863.1 RNA polymerase subunit sigma [Segatella bryantii]